METELEVGIVKWNPEFYTGIDRIDFEHKIFLELVNSFRFAINKGMSAAELNRIISEIEKYAEFHFISEENFMFRINYPDFTSHQNDHFELLEQFNLTKYTFTDYLQFHEFLCNWFVHHTIEVDQALRVFVDSGKIKIEDFFYTISIC